MELAAFDLAAQQCGHAIVGACEIDKYARSIYIRQFPGVHVHTDATQIDPSELPRIDLLCAGFPCQAFSIAGRRRGFEDARGTLFFEIAKIAKAKRCNLLLENVRGLLGHDQGRTWQTMLTILDDMRYNVQWQCINTKHYAPQNRERLYIVANPREKPTPQIFPITDGVKVNAGARRTPGGKRKRIDAHCKCITKSYHKGWGAGRTMIMTGHQNSNIINRTQHRDNTWALTTNPHTQAVVDNGQACRVYDTNGTSVTLCARNGGQGAGTGLYTTADGIRRLTPLECERLQTFPDNWTARGHDDAIISDTQRYKMIGNAVTVKVVLDIMQRLGGAVA